ncbi:CAP domain-containing protein [Phyllobacterium sp. LjRoot231]|uniref:CAP domain-containing protein n=1 Tax=Phyllobacterium sp. LjRoot231 TaxID=3342289 RepID=UPI003ED07BDD
MSEKNSHLSRRNFLGFAAAAAIMPLAACQTVTRTPGKSAGASTSAVSNMQAIRSASGLGGLTPDSTLERAALQQAGYMASTGRMSHTTLWGRSFAARAKGNGIHGAAAENIARGRMDMNQVFASWMASPPHRRNMLDPRFTRFGLAYAESTNGSTERYWSLLLAS